ncbi:helix-hairpin-helix domain-containing protein [Erwinia sp. ErVv1]|uniref:helix-hairpin-helix domain-containing protein n=1 Tax=Erwinia sp. ErVv1 TaxID=1603299 RepID=UPI0008339352|nr:helix-hairpin-helix domain-containing protein [Erwinia sp. ErVv1]
MKHLSLSALFFALALSPLALSVAQAETATSRGAEPGLQMESGRTTTDGQISINHATAEEFAAALNGVGLKKAEAIVSYRDRYGAFTQIEQLKEVPGMGNALVERNLSRLKL